MISTDHILIISSLLFALGLMGLMLQKNILRILLCVEAMFNAAAFGFIGICANLGNLDGHIMFFIILAVAASEVCIALAIVVNYDRLFKTLEITE